VYALCWVGQFMCALGGNRTDLCNSNRAITLGDGRDSLQLVYAPGFTILSVFLPVIGLTAAFAAAEYRTAKPLHHWLALSITGIIAGLSIVGMHYIGNLGISNYKLKYNPRFLAAAFVIAEGDCLLVLVLFYTWREAWINSWWKRLFCASFLAGGVSSMHFTASVGCQYIFQQYAAAGRMRDVQVLIAGSLCGAAVLTFLTYLFVTRHKAYSNKKRASKVVLTCAVFDPEGRILVNTDGTLPAREITDRYNSTGFTDEFNTGHSVMQWMFRVTYNWSGVTDLVPKMKSHLLAQSQNNDAESRPGSKASSTVWHPSTYTDYSVIFRERFCVAAANLASSLNVPLDKLGVLYDRIIETATLPDSHQVHRSTQSPNKKDDIEMGADLRKLVFGKGQILFVVRQVGNDERDKLLNAGFRFAAVLNVTRTIAVSLQVPVAVLESHCVELQRYVKNLEQLDKSGTWLSLFAPIAKAHGGFDIVANKYAQNQLPDVQLLKEMPQAWQHEFLSTMDGLRPHACLRQMEKRLAAQEEQTPQTIREKVFASTVMAAVQDLNRRLPPEWFSQSHFIAKPHYAHYSKITGGQALPSVLYSFVVMADMHVAIDTFDSVARVPMSFFSTRQRCYTGSPDHQNLARDIHAEFGPLLGRKIIRSKPSRPSGVSGKFKRRDSAATSEGPVFKERKNSYTDTDTSSENGLVDHKGDPIAVHASQLHDAHSEDGIIARRDNSWGGIMVNSEMTVQTEGRLEAVRYHDRGFGSTSSRGGAGPGGGAGAGSGNGNMGLQTAVSTAKEEDTFVEELMAVTRAKFIPPKPGY
jgi:NO-binding membrane sensor protein with MHYT domain